MLNSLHHCNHATWRTRYRDQTITFTRAIINLFQKSHRIHDLNQVVTTCWIRTVLLCGKFERRQERGGSHQQAEDSFHNRPQVQSCKIDGSPQAGDKCTFLFYRTLNNRSDAGPHTLSASSHSNDPVKQTLAEGEHGPLSVSYSRNSYAPGR